MHFKIRGIPNAVLRESSLPYLALPLQLHAQRMGIAAFDELDSAFQGDTGRRSEQQVNVFGHDDKSVQFESPLPSIAVECL